MMKEYYNTNVLAAARMLDVTDEDILEWSNGEVRVTDPNGDPITDESEFVSEKIFGELSDGSTAMGHIVSPVPFVNINYVRGPKPVLPELLHMNRSDVEGIINQSLIINIDTTEIKKAKDVRETAENLVTGADAIELLLKKNNQPTEKIILHNMPVLPLSFRFEKRDGSGIIRFPLEVLYFRFAKRCCRYRNFVQLATPSVIIETERLFLQKAADALINNGVCATPFSISGVPAESLADAAYMISTLVRDHTCCRCECWNKYRHLLDSEKIASLVNRYCGICSVLDDGDSDLTEEDRQKAEKLLAEILKECEVMVSTVREEKFSDYSDYADELTFVARQGMTGFIIEADDEMAESEITGGLIYAAYMQMKSFVENRVQWYETDRELYSAESSEEEF